MIPIYIGFILIQIIGVQENDPQILNHYKLASLIQSQVLSTQIYTNSICNLIIKVQLNTEQNLQ